MWYTDRSRYEAGFTCPWRRYLGYHANYTGLSPISPHPALTVGILVHKGLEDYLKTGKLIIPNLEAAATPGVWESASLQFYQDVIEALIRGWAHTTYPWLTDNFDWTVAGVEEEMNLDFPHDDLPIRWMARPDLVARRKSDGRLTVHDFKTVSSWRDSYLTEWGDSLQLMMNAHVAAQKYGEPVPHYYVHFLVKGSEDWPTHLTHAWHKEANPPLEAEEWRLKKPYGRSAQMFQKVRVANHIPLEDWIPRLDPATLAKYFIVGGPFSVNPYKVRLFTDGLLSNEWWWKEALGTSASAILDEFGTFPDLDNPNVRGILNRYFPRTFNCYTYNSRCSFYDLCLKPGTLISDKFTKRDPHHPQEEIL